jgi:hypothetical protein
VATLQPERSAKAGVYSSIAFATSAMGAPHARHRKRRTTMRIRRTHAAALALAGVLTAAAVTPSVADSRWGYAAGGFAVGALTGAAIANANAGYYHHPGYAYHPGYSYGYQGYAYVPEPSVTYVERRPMYGWGYQMRPGTHAPNYDPENAMDPDPRIGGSVKVNSSGDD